MIDVTPLTSDSSSTALLLTIEGVRVLLDTGGSGAAAPDWLSRAQDIDLVLLSHGDLAHIGSFADGCKLNGWGNSCPVYATQPTTALGRMSAIDAAECALHPDLSTADIDAAFDSIVTLRYSQQTMLSAKLNGFTITAFCAGRTLGGTIWLISKNFETIVYAVDWNHSREKHLKGAVIYQNGRIHDALLRPYVLITSAANARRQIKPRQKRFTALVESCFRTLNAGGSVLIPSDAASRSIELCCIFESLWLEAERTNKGHIHKQQIFFLSPVANRTIHLANSMVEWMNENILQGFSGNSPTVLDFKFVKFIDNIEEFQTLRPAPRVIIATTQSLNSGPAQHLLKSIASDEKNLVILSMASIYPAGSIAGKMLAALEKQLLKSDNATVNGKQTSSSSKKRQQKSVGTADNDQALTALDSIAQPLALNIKLKMELRRRVPLEGSELGAYEKEQEDKRRKETEKIVQEIRSWNLLEQDEESSSDDESVTLGQSKDKKSSTDSSWTQIGSSAFIHSNTHDLYMTDPNLEGLPLRYKVFPLVEKRMRSDIFGVSVKIDDFTKADKLLKTGTEGRDGVDNRSSADSNRNIGLDATNRSEGKKRKWDTVGQDSATGKSNELSDVRALPTKCVQSTETVTLKCLVQYIDLEGLHDSRSLKTILPQMNARKLVFVRGSDAEKHELADHMKQLGLTKIDVFCPKRYKCVDVTVDIDSFDLHLADELMRDVQWKAITDKQVAHIIGKVTSEDKISHDTGRQDGDDIGRQLAGDTDEKNDQLILQPLVVRQDLEKAFAPSQLFVGNVQLIEMKRILQENGHTAEFGGQGVLLCDQKIAIKKLHTGQTIIEGPPCEQYYSVRQFVYGMLAAV